MRYLRISVLAGLAAFLCAGPAAAYVGPGAGLTLLGALWGLVAALVMTVGFIVLWPFRRFLFAKRRNAGGGREADAVEDGEAGDSAARAEPTDRPER